jgi:hypothetical protein
MKKENRKRMERGKHAGKQKALFNLKNLEYTREK